MENIFITRKYYKEADIIKGIAILLVILGHSFCVAPIDIAYSLPELSWHVRSFQMPLFFMVSGFLFRPNKKMSDFLKGKVQRLIIPYLSFSFILSMIRVVKAFYIGEDVIDTLLTEILGIAVGSGYWFLYSLFAILLVFQFLTLIKPSNSYQIYYIFGVIMFCLVLLTDVEEISIFTIGRSLYYTPFFVFGIYINKIYNKLCHDNFPQKLLILGTLAILYFSTTHLLKSSQNDIVVYFLKLLGVIFASYLSLLLTKSKYLSDILVHFGKFSLQYYLNHQLFVAFLFIVVYKVGILNPLCALLFIFVIAVLVSWIMLKFERNSIFLSFISGLKR